MSTRTTIAASKPKSLPGTRWWREIVPCRVCKGKKTIQAGLLRRDTVKCHHCGGTGEYEINRWFVAPAIMASIALLIALIILTNGGV